MTTALRHPPALELRDVPASGPWDTIRRASRLISRRVGLIRQVFESCYQAQDPAVFTTGLKLSDFTRSVNGGKTISASGAGDSAEAALAAAIGEAAERQCSSTFDRDEMVLGSFEELAGDAVPPDTLRLFSREQTERFAPGGPVYFDERSRIRWVWGYSLTERCPRLVPASLVYLNFRALEGEANIGENASTGLAAGATREEAILSGLLETIERDAYMLAWMHRQPGRRLDVDDGDLQDVLKRRLFADRPGVDVKLFDLTTDVPVPVVYTIMRRRAELGPVPCQGLASRVAPRRAVRKSLHEAAQNFPFIRGLMAAEKDWWPAEDFSNVTTFDYHFLTYLKRPELVPPALDFFDACEDRVALSAVPDHSTGRVLGDIEYCVRSLARAGYETIAVDITTPDIADVGLSVVRVVVPGLVPIHGNHLRPFLGVRRLYEAPYRIGWDRRGWSPEAGLNHVPHTFP